MRSNQLDFVGLRPALLIWPSHRPRHGLRRCLGCSVLWGSLLCLVLLLLAGSNSALAALPPTNDVCSGAEIIPRNGPFPHLTAVTVISFATTNGDPPLASCAFGNPFSHSIWYSFTPQDTTNYTISSCAEAPTATTVPDTFMAIYRSSGGCGGTLSELPLTTNTIGCADDSCGPGFTQAAITTQLFADTAYYIVVWQSDLPPPVPNPSVQLRIAKTQPPRNDTGAGVTNVILNSPVLGTTILAHNDYQLPSGSPCFPAGQIASTASGRDVVYSFTAPTSGNYSIKVHDYNSSDGYDLVLYAASSIPTGPSPATVSTCLGAANRNPASSAEEISCLALAANQKIYIFVDEDVSSPEGSSFSLEITRCIREDEPNNTWTNANLLISGVQGSIDPVGDVDFYSLGMFPAGSRVFAMIDGSAANVTDLRMRVIAVSPNSTNTLEYDSGNDDPLFGSLSSNVAGTPLTDAPAYLRINGSGLQKVDPYRLYGVVQPPMGQATWETEPNDTPAQANMADNNYFYGALTSAVPNTVSADVDVYAFSVEAVDLLSDLIFLSLDADPFRTNHPINAKLELLDGSGNVLVTVDDPSSTSSTTTTSGSMTATVPFSPAEALVFRTLVDGTYYARVSMSPGANPGNGSGYYLLSISRNGFIGSCGCNTPPALTNVAFTPPVYQNLPSTLSGTIIDYDIGQSHQVVIDWGDGSSATTNNLPAGVVSFSLSHTYTSSMSNASVNVSVQDAFDVGAPASVNVTVQPQPTSAYLISICQTNGHELLQLQGSPGATYRIQASAALSGWADLATSTAGTNGLFQIEDATSPPPPQRFYRAIWP